MRLLIDGVFSNSPGIQILRQELIRGALRNRPSNSRITLLQSHSHKGLEPSEELEIDNIKDPPSGWIGRWYWYNRILPQKIKKYKADVFYSLSGIIPEILCQLCGTINTVNNMVPFTPTQIKDLPLFSKEKLRVLLLRKLYIQSLKRADVVILHSQFSLNLISQWMEDLSRKTFVELTGVPQNCQSLKSMKHPNNKKPYFFYLSAIYRHKNHLNLIRAYECAIKLAPNLPDLIIAGYPVDMSTVTEMRNLILQKKLNGRVKYLEELNRESVPEWIHFAAINIFPSTCETNSLVQSEILGMHGVMACSNIPPMTEIAGDAAEYFDPFKPDSIAHTIIRLWNDQSLCNELRIKSKKRASELSWDRCGKMIWKAVENAHESFKKRKPITDNQVSLLCKPY